MNDYETSNTALPAPHVAHSDAASATPGDETNGGNDTRGPVSEPAPMPEGPASDDLPPPPPGEPPMPDDAHVTDAEAAFLDLFGLVEADTCSSPPFPEVDAPGRSPRGWALIRRCDGLIPPLRLLAELALAEVLPIRVVRAMRRGDPVVVLVSVPSPAWVAIVDEVFVTASNRLAHIVAKASRPRHSTSAQDPDTDAGDRIGAGKPLVAIAPDRAWLAPMLVAAADHEVTVPPLSPGLVRRAIRLWTGRSLRSAVRPGDIAGLDILDVAAALRPGATPGASLARLRRASRSRIGLPETERVTPLEELTGYGAAHVWACDLVRAIGKVRSGTMNAALLEGCVLYGKPGLGKTVFARSIAQAANVPFAQTSIGEWFSQSNGHLDGVIKMCDRFADALTLACKTSGTAIGFIDELDALPNRARLSDRGADWWLPVITHVLIRFEALRKLGIVLLAATNHLERVDAALLRPGRFDRQFLIEPPDEAARLGILRAHLGDDLTGVDLAPAARLSAGMSGATLAGHVRAARRRAEDSDRPMTLNDLIDGIAPADGRSADERRTVAVHESGHAVVAQILGLALSEASIQAGADYAGSTTVRLDDPMPTRAALERRVVSMLAGRAADAVIGIGVNAGAASDLREATRLVTAMHACLGLARDLSVRVGPDVASALLREDPALAERVEADLRRLAREAARLVRLHRAAIRAVADELLARRVLTGEEVAKLVAEHSPGTPQPADRSTRASVRKTRAIPDRPGGGNGLNRMRHQGRPSR